jgi:hypothetical protein
MVTRAIEVTRRTSNLAEITTEMADTGDTVILDPAVELQVAGDISDLLQTKHCDAFTFTEPEDLALNLYDQLRELELQQSLVKAHNLCTSYCSADLEI